MSAPKDYIRDFMSEPVIDAKGAALVIIDMQYATGARQGALGRTLKAQGSTLGDYRFARIEQSVLPRTLDLRAHFHRIGQPVVHVTLGAALPDAGDAPRHMRKLLASCNNYVGAFASTSIDSLLRSLNVDQIYMAGVSTNMCVESTAREAADRGYQVTLVEDACGTTFEELHQVTLRNFQRLFGRVTSTAEAVAELKVSA